VADNILPDDPHERALALRIIAARNPKFLRKNYREMHAAKDVVCDPMTGFCSQLSVALFHATGGKNGPYRVFRIDKEHLGGEGTHWFLVDVRKLPRIKGNETDALRLMNRPEDAIVDLTASQFGSYAIPYKLGKGASLAQVEGGDTKPTVAVANVLSRAGLAGGAFRPDASRCAPGRARPGPRCL
jgi:hypothetical protein